MMARFARLYGWVEMVSVAPWLYTPIGAVLFAEPFYVLPRALLIEHGREA